VEVRGVALALLVAACGPAPHVEHRPVERGGAARGGSERLLAERLWSERLDETRLRASLAAWKRAVALDDADVDSYLMAARASHLLADGFLAIDGRKDEMRRVFEEGAALADRGLRALSPAYEARRRGGDEVDAAAAGLGKEAAPLLYWWAMNAIRWADAEGFTASMRLYKHVFRAMEQVLVLDPAYDHAGADRFFGSARAESPAIAGGDLGRSRAHFDRALAIAPDRLETHLQLARHYARRAGDAALYERSLRLVLESPSDRLPGAAPEQEIAKKKARGLPPRL
jgi:tetratricopeptide (TPR) repeat protein